MDIVLYDSDDTVLATISVDKDVLIVGGIITNLWTFPEAPELSANVFRRLVVKPTTTTNVQTQEITVDAAAILDSFENGQDFHLTTRVDGGAWTDTLTERPMMGLLCDAFDDGVGAAETQQGATHISLVI